MKHPNSLALEAFSCGEPSESVESHLQECEACRAFVANLREVANVPVPAAQVRAMIARAQRTERVPASLLRRVAFSVTPIVLPLAAAAVFVLFLQRQGNQHAQVTAEAPHVASTTSEPTDFGGATTEPDTRFKGTAQVAVVRDRAGKQARFASTTSVRAGDRVRIEVALDREQRILGAVLGDDGSYLELMPAAVRGAGTHFSERSARIDASPTSGTILVGSPEAVERARATKDFSGVATLRLDVEGAMP